MCSVPPGVRCIHHTRTDLNTDLCICVHTYFLPGISWPLSPLTRSPSTPPQAQFGTLSEYFSALEAESKRAGAATALASFPRLSGDFFTYADKNDEYWSGYFTTRPFHKQMDRVLMAQLRSAAAGRGQGMVYSGEGR